MAVTQEVSGEQGNRHQESVVQAAAGMFEEYVKSGMAAAGVEGEG